MNELTLTVKTGAKIIPMIDADGTQIGSFRFNPSDTNIIYRYKDVVDFFENNIREFAIGVDESSGDEEVIEKLATLQNAVNEKIDLLLGYAAHDTVFEKCGALTVTEEGDFFYEQVIEGVAKLVEQVTKQRLKKMEKIRKATARYQKK